MVHPASSEIDNRPRWGKVLVRNFVRLGLLARLHARMDHPEFRTGGRLSRGLITTYIGMATTTPIHLMIADAQHLVRRGLRAMLDRLPGMDVVAEAGTLKEAIGQY